MEEFEVEELVLALEGPLLYEARIKKVIKINNGFSKYRIHYQNWNKRYDVWATKCNLIKHTISNIELKGHLETQLHCKKSKTKRSSIRSSNFKAAKRLSSRRSEICVTNSLQNDDIDRRNYLDNPREDPICQYRERNDFLHQNHFESPCNGEKAYSDTGLVRSNIQMIPTNGNRLHDFNFIACDTERRELAINKDHDPFGKIDLVEFKNVSIPTDAINSSSSDVCEKVGAQTKVNIDPIIDDEMQGASIEDNGNNEMKIYNSTLDSVITNPSSMNIENTAQNYPSKFMGKYDDANDTTCPKTSSLQLLTNLLVSKDDNSKNLKKSTSKITSDNLARIPNTNCSKQKNTSCKLSEKSPKNNACHVNGSSSLATRNMRKRSPVDYKQLSLEGSEASPEKLSNGLVQNVDKLSISSNKNAKTMISCQEIEEKRHDRALYGNISPPKDFECLDDYSSRGSITGSKLSQNDALPDLEEYSSNEMLGFPKPDNQNFNVEPKSRKKQILLSTTLNTMKNSNSVISEQKQVTKPAGSTMGAFRELSAESASIRHFTNAQIASSVSSTREKNSTQTAKPTIIPIKRKLTLEHRHKYPVSNGEILNFLTKKKTLSYLKRILNEKVKSQRHDIVCNMFRSGKLDFSMRSKIFQLTRADFLENDHKIDNQLLKTMSKVLEGVNVSKIPGMLANPADSLVYQGPDNRNNYIWHVLVPEAIIKYLQEKNGWDKSNAEKFYLDGESRVTDEELKEFDEELEEDARRYQRQKLEDSYDSSEEDEWLDEHEDVDMDLPNIS